MRLQKILPLAALLALVLPAGQAFAGGPKPKLQLSASTYAVAENGGSATITVLRQGNAKRVNQSATVNYATSDGTARAGTDYTAQSGTLSFASGDQQKTFTVPVVDNRRADGPRTVNIRLSSPTASGGRAMLGFPSTATLVISDDEANDPASGTGSSFQLAEAGDTVSEGAASVKAFVIRSGDLSRSASVDYATADGSALAGTDYTTTSGALSFPSQSTDATTSIIQAVTIPLRSNTASTEPTRWFRFGLALPSGSTDTLGTPSSKTITIVNVDGPPTIQWSASSFSAPETDGSVRLTAFVTGRIPAGAEIDVDYTFDDGSAVDGVNYNRADDTLQFTGADSQANTPADVALSFDVPLLRDGATGDKFFTSSLAISATSPDPGTIGTPDIATVNVLNTDPAAPSSENQTDTGSAATTTTTVVNGAPAIQQGGGEQVVAGARQAACGLKVRYAKRQRLLKQKGLRIKVRAGQDCKVAARAVVKQRKSKKAARGAKALRLRGKRVRATLKPGKARVLKVKFTRKSLRAAKKALAAHKKLVATVVVAERDAASNTKRRTLKITIRR